MAGVRRFEDLACWQLAGELKRAIYGVLDRETVRRDVRFCDQLRDAAASPPRNIAEGFGRRTHPEFARYLDIARGSLLECRNHLHDAVDRRHLDATECARLLALTDRTLGAIAALQRYLRSTPTPRR